MKNKFNTLHKYIFENSVKQYHKETVNGLFRAILEPVVSNQSFKTCIFFKLSDIENKKSVLRRLSFSEALTYGFNDNLSEFNIKNIQKDDIWGNTEFVVILGQRYSAALIWDFSVSENSDYTDVCILYNSKIIKEIAGKIAENSSVGIKELILKYQPDRRENSMLNNSIRCICSLLNDKNEDLIFNEEEKKHLVCTDDTIQTANIVAQKAKFIAHEIKNNLSIINLYTKIVEKRLINIEIECETSESFNNALKNITNASENVSGLISDLRCLSAPYITEVNLKQLILNTVMMCAEKAEKAGVKIELENIDDIVISTDKTKFQCALTNIIFNAVEACKKSCTINIYSEVMPDYISVFVKNNGDMIPPEIRNKIFEPDFTTKEKGNGLGLAICRKQLELVNGNIKFIHSNEKETLFEIVLPLK